MCQPSSPSNTLASVAPAVHAALGVGKGQAASVRLGLGTLADIDVQMYPVLRRLSFGNRLEEQAGAFACRVNDSATPQLLRDALVRCKFRPARKTFGRLLEAVAKGHRPKPGHYLDVVAVKGHLEWVGHGAAFRFGCNNYAIGPRPHAAVSDGGMSDRPCLAAFSGTRSAGRAVMQDAHDRLFRGVLTGSILVGEIESIRYLNPDTALIHANASVLTPWRSKLPRGRLSRRTLVAVRTDVGWLFTALHNGRVRPVQIPAPGSMPARMARFMGNLAHRLGLGRARAGGAV